VTVQNSHKFQSDRWIAIKLLLQFPDALFHGVDEESILGDDEKKTLFIFSTNKQPPQS
jgi:hypothetical protein